MRHASAGPGDGQDHARELTERGRHEADLVGRWLASIDWAPDRVLCSSARRCCETWQALSAGLEGAAPIQFKDALYNAPPVILLDALSDSSAATSIAGEAKNEIVLLIAHNPGISQLAFDLAAKASTSARLRSGFAPAALACFELSCPWPLLSPGAARLIHVQKPADLAPLPSKKSR
ncbi:MAG: histidine phosphatase family protein [Myxococcota bacterium]